MTKKARKFAVTRQGRRSGFQQTNVVEVARKAEAAKEARRQFRFQGPWGSEATTVTKVEEVGS